MSALSLYITFLPSYVLLSLAVVLLLLWLFLLFLSSFFQNDWTPLHIAAYHGHAEIVDILLACGADATIKDKSGHKALYYAQQQLKEEEEIQQQQQHMIKNSKHPSVSTKGTTTVQTIPFANSREEHKEEEQQSIEDQEYQVCPPNLALVVDILLECEDKSNPTQ